jgi:cell division transport system permease protein
MTYAFSEAVLNVRHGGVVSLLAIVVVALTTILFSALYVLRNAVRSEVQRFEENPSAVVFPLESATDEQVHALETAVSRLPGVARTLIVWKDDARERSVRVFGEESALLLQGFEDENPLPRSVEVFSTEAYRGATAVDALVNSIRELEAVETVVYESEALHMMERMRSGLFLLGGLVALISVVVISFSIMLTIYARRDELVILQLVGATYGFIRVPLLLQGCIEGFLGSAFGLGLFYILFDYFASSVGLAAFLTMPQIALVVGGATMIGMLGGLIPMRRRLRLAHQ